MSEQEYEALLALANAWDAIGQSHEREMRRNRSLADHHQKRGEKPLQDFHRAEAVNYEIRAQIYKDVAKVLALKLGELRQKEKPSAPLQASA